MNQFHKKNNVGPIEDLRPYERDMYNLSKKSLSSFSGLRDNDNFSLKAKDIVFMKISSIHYALAAPIVF